MPEQYEIEKWLWTDQDFEVMGWHDTRIHAVAFFPEAFELALDIDYIFQWIDPRENEAHFTFWVAPATWVFEGVYELRFDTECDFGEAFEIDSVERSDAKAVSYEESGRHDWLWKIETQQGLISLRSVGYKQYIRGNAIHTPLQFLEIGNRGGISFHRGRVPPEFT
jgi:hypothetical protein